MPSSSTSTVSPGFMGPIPAGVPVETTSPGSRVMEAVMKASISGILVINKDVRED